MNSVLFIYIKEIKLFAELTTCDSGNIIASPAELWKNGRIAAGFGVEFGQRLDRSISLGTDCLHTGQFLWLEFSMAAIQIISWFLDDVAICSLRWACRYLFTSAWIHSCYVTIYNNIIVLLQKSSTTIIKNSGWEDAVSLLQAGGSISSAFLLPVIRLYIVTLFWGPLHNIWPKPAHQHASGPVLPLTI